MEDEISCTSSTKASDTISPGAAESSLMDDPPTPLFVERIRKTFTNESELDESESCFEFDPHSSDSIFDDHETNSFVLPEKNRRVANPTWEDPITDLRIKNSKCITCTLGEIVQELCLHLQPVLVSTIKEVLTENISAINSTKAADSLTASATDSLSNLSHTSSIVNYGVDEEMKEIKKILDNPWNPDEIFDLSRLQIETMDSWKKNFGRLNKVFEDMKGPLNVEDSWDSRHNFGAICSNSNQTSQVQHHSPVPVDQKAVKSRKLFRVCISSFIVVVILVVAAILAFTLLELDLYSVREDVIWLRLRRRPHFFLSLNFG